MGIRDAASMLRRIAFVAAAAVLLALAGCTSIRLDVPHPVSTAWDAPEASALGRAFAGQLVEPGGTQRRSGLFPLSSGIDALTVRAALAEAAEHTLDLQYYIVRGDTTTQLLMARVLRASQRGVRVRLLVDDLDAAGKDVDLATLAGFDHVDVRVFNPFASRGAFGLSQIVEFIGDAQRLNRRMHNKVWIADNAVAVIGGRNLGDEYFDAGRDVNFTDLDVVLAGPAVAEVSSSFDAYWNSPWAVPIEAFVEVPASADRRARFERELHARVETFRDTAYARAAREAGLGRRLAGGQVRLIPATVEAFADLPDKVSGAQAQSDVGSLFASRLRPIVETAKDELILISPYFIPSPAGLEVLAALVRRGVRVRVLTNSLASADLVPLAHAGYARHRVELLRAGVELHELRPDRHDTLRGRLARGASAAYLHAKAIVVDRRWVVVGSMNLDPRSRLSNTEIGLLADSAELGAAIGTLFDDAVVPARAYTVQRADGPWPDELRWLSEDDDGRPVVHDREPGVGAWRRLLAALLRLFAPEALL